MEKKHTQKSLESNIENKTKQKLTDHFYLMTTATIVALR